MNNANFSSSQGAHAAVQEAGRERWGLPTVWQWLFPLPLIRKRSFIQGTSEMTMQLGWEAFTEKSPNQTLGFHINFCATRANKQ